MPTATRDHPSYPLGIDRNLQQFSHQVLQVFLVGLTVGMMRVVIPALAESEFGVAEGSFLMLSAFVVAFGFVKGTMNFVAGRLSERIGRRRVLLLGWLAALPTPFMIFYAPSWNWVVAATVLLGVNQGLAWSMTQAAKVDISRAGQRGFAVGMNEFSGYVGVAIAGVVTGYLATALGPRLGLFIFGVAVVGVAVVLALLWIHETRHWAEAEGRQRDSFSKNVRQDEPDTRDVFVLMSWRDRRMAAFCQAGLVEKFVDALIWVFYPVYLYERGLELAAIGWVTGIYGVVWGASQFITGRLSDHVGRLKPIVGGMWLCGAGVAVMPLGSGVVWWSGAAAVTGLGMGLLYPNLITAVGDAAHPRWRISAIGIYRFWRDLGYGIGALAFGLVANLTGVLTSGFWLVPLAMFLSGALVLWWGEETHPRLSSKTAVAGVT